MSLEDSAMWGRQEAWAKAGPVSPELAKILAHAKNIRTGQNATRSIQWFDEIDLHGIRRRTRAQQVLLEALRQDSPLAVRQMKTRNTLRSRTRKIVEALLTLGALDAATSAGQPYTPIDGGKLTEL